MLRERMGSLAAALDAHAAQRRTIDAALARIDDPGFGACETCGAPIAWERLLDVPYRAHCTRCEVPSPAADAIASTAVPSGSNCSP